MSHESGSQRTALFLNAGHLRFVDATSMLPGALSAGTLVDLDGDGALDVIAHSFTCILVATNDGTGSSPRGRSS